MAPELLALRPQQLASAGSAEIEGRPELRTEPGSPKSGAAAGAKLADLGGHGSDGEDVNTCPSLLEKREMAADGPADSGEAPRGSDEIATALPSPAGGAELRPTDRPQSPAARPGPGGDAEPDATVGPAGPAAPPASAPGATNAGAVSNALAGISAADDDGCDDYSELDGGLLQPGAHLPYDVVRLKCRGIRQGGYRWELKSAPPPHDVESSSCPRKGANGAGSPAPAPRAPASPFGCVPRTAAWHAVTAVATELVSQMSHPHLRLAVAYTDEARGEALKLFRDLNHLSLRGGISCERVVSHHSSHTILLQVPRCAASHVPCRAPTSPPATLRLAPPPLPEAAPCPRDTKRCRRAFAAETCPHPTLALARTRTLHPPRAPAAPIARWPTRVDQWRPPRSVQGAPVRVRGDVRHVRALRDAPPPRHAPAHDAPRLWPRGDSLSERVGKGAWQDGDCCVHLPKRAALLRGAPAAPPLPSPGPRPGAAWPAPRRERGRAGQASGARENSGRARSCARRLLPRQGRRWPGRRRRHHSCRLTPPPPHPPLTRRLRPRARPPARGRRSTSA